jgi:uncharacterized protein with gpF-like domain
MEPVDNLVLRRQTRLDRYINGLDAKYDKVMQASDDKHLAKIRRLVAAMTARDLRAFQQNKKTQRTVRLRKLLDEWTADYKAALKVQMSEGYDDIYKAERKAIPGDRVQTVDSPPRLIMGATVPATAAASGVKFRKYLDSGIKQAIADGRDPNVFLNGSSDIGYSDAATETRDRSAYTHISTAVLAGAATGRLIAYAEIGIKKVRWLSTLDNRTCAICASRDGQVYTKYIGSGLIHRAGSSSSAPAMPAHYRCRCVYTADVSTRARRGALNTDDPKDAYTVKPGTTYDSWLKSQPEKFQKEVLTKTRYKLYKEGKLKLSSFSDERTGRIYTLKDLERKEKAAWSRAGLGKVDKQGNFIKE